MSAVSAASDAAKSVRNCSPANRRAYFARLRGVGEGDELETAREEVLAGEVVAQVESAQRLQHQLRLLEGGERELVLHTQLGEERGDAGRFLGGKRVEELGWERERGPTARYDALSRRASPKAGTGCLRNSVKSAKHLRMRRFSRPDSCVTTRPSRWLSVRRHSSSSSALQSGF